MPDTGSPLPQDLQFQHAEHIGEITPPDTTSPACVACQQPVGETYFHAQGQVVCPQCAGRIQSGQQKPPALSLLRAALYGGGAALAGCAIYALVAILLDAEIGFVAILVGWMVGKAIRSGSHGLGGRPQQILAVVLTYFAISTSYIPVMIYAFAKNPGAVQKAREARRAKQRGNAGTNPPATDQGSQPEVQQPGQLQAEASPASNPAEGRRLSVLGFLIAFATLATVAPFMQLAGGLSGLISLFILFIGMHQAWRLTGRSQILVMGPYPVEPQQ